VHEPDTLYARYGSARIAYQVLGDGPIDVIATSASFGSMDAEWENPEIAAFNREVAEFCRYIRYDGLGSGASDPLPIESLPPIESAAEEIIAVLDAAGSEQAVLAANSGSVPVALFAAATNPERISALVLMHAFARMLADDDYPEGLSPEVVAGFGEMFEVFDIDEVVRDMFPSRADDERFMRWGRKYVRAIASPGAFVAFIRRLIETDARSTLPLIRVPTLVLHRSGFEQVPMSAGRYVADHIEGARFEELPGSEGVPWFDHPTELNQAIREFVTSLQPAAQQRVKSRRAMATVLFTDMVQSTERAREMGDAKWGRMLDLHFDIASRCVEEQLGRIVKTTGDGILATFDGPGRAILAASAMSNDLMRVGLPIRAGIHTGEVELLGEDVGGIGVHLAARIMGLAGSGEIFVSQTVRDLVAGSDFSFEDRGVQHLKGIDGDWQVFALL
jgi:class 3 adenylate cyclase